MQRKTIEYVAAGLWAGLMLTGSPALAETDPLGFGAKMQSVQTGIRIGEYTITADEVGVFPEGVELRNVKLLSDKRDGEIRAQSARFDDPSLLPVLLGQSITAQGCLEDGISIKSKFRFEGLNFIPDADASMRDGTEERLIFQTASGLVTGSGCDFALTTGFEGVQFFGVGGDRLELSSIGGSVKLDNSGPVKASIRFSGDGVHLDGIDGPQGFSIGEWGVSGQFDQASLQALYSSIQEGVMADTIKTISTLKFSSGAYFKELSLDVVKFFPPQEVDRLGLQEVDFLEGDASFSLNAASGRATFRSDYDISNLVEGNLSMVMNIPSEASGFLPPMIADKLPFPKELLGLELVSLSAAYKDEGAGEVFEKITGDPVQEKLGRVEKKVLSKLEGKAPSAAIDLVISAFEGLSGMAQTGGAFKIIPDDPVSLLSLSLRAMTMPAGLPEYIGFETDDEVALR